MRRSELPRGLEFSASIADGIGGGSVVTVYGELDMASAPAVRHKLELALEGEGEVVVDLRGCGFIDSSGIATLVYVGWRLKDQQRVLRIRGARERVRRSFDLAGLAGHPSIVLEAGQADDPA